MTLCVFAFVLCIECDSLYRPKHTPILYKHISLCRSYGSGYYASTGYPLPAQQYVPPQQPQQQQHQLQQRYPSDPSHSNAYPREGVDYRRPLPAGRNAEPSNSPGLVGKFKSIFGLDDSSAGDASYTSGGYGYSKGNANVRSSQLPPHLAQPYASYGTTGAPTSSASASSVANPFGDNYLEGNLPQQVSPYGTGIPSFPGEDRGAGSGPGEYPDMPVQKQQPYPGRDYSSSSSNSGGYDAPPSADSVSAGLPTHDASYTSYRDGTTSTNPALDHLTPTPTTATATATAASVDPVTQISPEPQVFVHEGSIVMINKPREFGRKKLAFTRAGSDKIQVFSDFEHVLTQFNTMSGERTLTSAELLETSGAVHDRAVQQLNAITEDFESSGDNYLDSAAFEQLSAQCQRVLCKEGDLHIGAVPQITR